MKRTSAIALLFVSLLLTGCVTVPNNDNRSDGLLTPTLETIEVEGHLVYYRDLSDPCDPNSTAWKNLKKRNIKSRQTIDCSTPIARVVDPLPNITLPERDFVLLFAMRKKDLSSPENDLLVAELASMRDWPIEYQVYGAAGGAGPLLEKLGMKRAAVVKEGLVSAGVPVSKIAIMPYDPTLPGLRAVVRVAGQGV